MASLSDMSRSEKEECVIRLCKENKSTREIAKLMHMSFRNIGSITKKVKLEANGGELEDDDIKSKSKTTQAIKLFSELKSPVEVAIELDLSVDQVEAIYQEYWKLEGMYGLAQIYEEAKSDVHDLLTLHRILKNRGMEKQDIINIFEYVKYNELRTMQAKVEFLRNDIDMLEVQKAKATNDILKLNRIIDEFQSSMPHKGGQIAYMNQESGWYDS